MQDLPSLCRVEKPAGHGTCPFLPRARRPLPCGSVCPVTSRSDSPSTRRSRSRRYHGCCGAAPLRWLVALALPLISAPWVGAQETRAQVPPVAPESSEAAVIRMAESFVRSLSAKDTALLSDLLAEDATLHSVRVGPAGPEIRLSNREEFLSSLGGDGRKLLERIWDPVATVVGSVAVVMAPYDFYVDDRFSHCGTDVFTFLREADGWKITGVTYDVVREGCVPGPLGPPGEDGPQGLAAATVGGAAPGVHPGPVRRMASGDRPAVLS
jgi:hypothetical protein